MTVMRVLAIALLGLAAARFSGCSKADKPTEGPELPEDKTSESLVGVWSTQGEDPMLGDVEVRFDLRPFGDLRVTVLLESGGRLTFSGSWAFGPNKLTLDGGYFEDGQSRVSCTLQGDSLLVLTDDAGRAQEWRRLE
ncbi:MAG: hypothetical protein VX733_09725 [Candidatus Latescibacterota bacterium]|nr:hypothetical protein [Candidatus Latescibacterota bacterium]